MKYRNSRIENKISKMLIKFGTDCLIGTIGYYDALTFKERKVIIVNNTERNIFDTPYIFIGNTGVSLLHILPDILYVRDLQDIAFNEGVFYNGRHKTINC